MTLYYKAVSPEGKKLHGFIDAKDPAEAALFIRKKNMIPIVISKESEKNFSSLLKFGSKLSSKDVVFITRQLASMLESGLTLSQSLVILKDQMQKPAASEVISGIITKIEGGMTLHEAMMHYPDVFNEVYISLIKAAETSGLLDKILMRMAENLEKQEKLRNTIRSALFYPAIIILLMIAVVIIMMVFVMPQLNVLYEDLNLALPPTTQFLVSFSQFFTQYLWLCGLLIGVGIYGFMRWYKSTVGRFIFDTVILRVPILGELIKKSSMVDFSRTFGLLVGAGSLIVDSLQKSGDVVSNSVFRKEIIAVSQRVEKGVRIGDAMAVSPIFPPLLLQMVKIGEQTGKLDESLLRVSEYYEREVDVVVKNLTTAIEPIILIVLALGVGFLLISVFTPLYSIINAIQ